MCRDAIEWLAAVMLHPRHGPHANHANRTVNCHTPFIDDYAKSHKLLNKSFPIDNGVIDSIMYLLSDFNYEQRVMLQNILMPF